MKKKKTTGNVAGLVEVSMNEDSNHTDIWK
jgi:hypothetical protein